MPQWSSRWFFWFLIAGPSLWTKQKLKKRMQMLLKLILNIFYQYFSFLWNLDRKEWAANTTCLLQMPLIKPLLLPLKFNLFTPCLVFAYYEILLLHIMNYFHYFKSNFLFILFANLYTLLWIYIYLMIF